MKTTPASSRLSSIFYLIDTLVRRISSRSSWRVSTWWPSDSRSAMQHSLLRLLVFANRQRIDPAPLVANLAREHRGIYRWRLQRLAIRLSEGTPLVEALEQTPDVLSDQTVLAIRFASQTGTLDSIYQSLVDRNAKTTNVPSNSFAQTMAYFLGMLLALSVVLTFLMVVIAPIQNQIYSEYGSPQPIAMRQLMGFSNWFSSNFPILVIVVLGISWVVFSPTSRRFFRRSIASRWFGNSRLARSAELLPLLATTTKSGRPLASAISTLARYHFDSNVRNKLLFVRNQMEQGGDVWETLAETRLLTDQESSSFSSLTGDSRSWGMLRLAEQKRRAIDLRGNRRAEWSRTIVVFIFAGIVLWIGLAFLDPMAKMLL